MERRLEEYRHTDAYEDQLEKMVEKAVALAETAGVQIFSPSDREKKERLEQKTRQQILIGKELKGGICAVIKEKNILLDESFGSRLQELREQYEL